MAEKGLFFNAFPDDSYETGYDRNYSADDISDWLSIICTSGVVKTDNEAGTGIPQGLKVVAAEGLNVAVNPGKATIRGKGYINNSLLNLSIETAPTGLSSRYDLIVLRQDNTQSVDARRNYVTVITGTSSIPTVNDLTRNSNVYDLLLGYVEVVPNATAIQQTNIYDTRGDQELCPYFTAVKGYDDYYDAIVQQFEYNTTLDVASLNVVTDLASSLYNNKYSLVNVYVNGLKEENTNYSVLASSDYITIAFTSTKNAGAEISVVLNNFIDGEGLNNALSDYNQWVNDVENLKTAFEYTYICNGVNDNVEICNIVNNFFTSSSGRYYQTLKLNVIGRFGYTASMSGDGSSTTPYIIFNFDKTNAGGRRAIVDFSNCNNLEFTPTAGKYTYIFSGTNLCIKGANVVAVATYTTGTSVIAFEHMPRVRAEDCRFWIYGYTNSYIATRGEFVNCKGNVRNYGGDSFCFRASNSVYLAVIGGEYTAHSSSSSSISAVIVSSNANAIAIVQDVIAPKIDLTNPLMYQKNSIYHTAGKLSCFGLVTQLTITSGTGATITGTISANPYNQLW